MTDQGKPNISQEMVQPLTCRQPILSICSLKRTPTTSERVVDHMRDRERESNNIIGKRHHIVGMGEC